MPFSAERQLLDIPTVCQRLSLSRTKVYELMGRGAIKSVHIDGSRRVRARDLEDYVERLGTPKAA